MNARMQQKAFLRRVRAQGRSLQGTLNTRIKESRPNDNPKDKTKTNQDHPPQKRPTQQGLSLSILIYKAVCFDVPQGRMNGAPNET